MLRALLDRLFGRPAVPAARRHRAAPKAADARPAAAGVVGAHRPLIAGHGGIAGFEFRIADATLQRLRARADPIAASAGATSLLAAMRLCAQGGQVAFCEMPAAWLLRLGAAAALHKGMLIALAADAPDDDGLAAALPAWRASGASIGWRPDAAPPGRGDAKPDFLLLPAAGAEPAALLATVRTLRSAHPGSALMMLDLPGLDAAEAMLQAGVTFACCTIEIGAEPKEARALPAQAVALLRLMNQLARDVDTAQVVASIKADVGLSYRLLRQLNSAALAPAAGELGSIEQAVALLGRNELYRWVSVLLVRQSPGRPASAALQSMALARARFFELLAEARGDAPAGALFTLGLASMLPTLLQTRMAEALAPLQLHAYAADALLERAGPWVPYLTLAEVLDEADLADAPAYAEHFGGLPQVMMLSAKAWLFASGATRT